MRLHGSRRQFLVGTTSLAGMSLWPVAVSAAALGYPRALQGPMVGAPGPSHFTVWVRASGAFDVTLEYATDRDFTKVLTGPTVKARSEDNCCVTLRAEGLRPDTIYWYRLKFDGVYDREQPFPYRTRTAPAGKADFRVAFGSCCRIQFDPEQPIWSVVQALEPDLFFWLGDNIYGDSDEPAALAELYGRGRLVRRLEPLLRSKPQLAIWDDHDFGYNGSDGTSPYKDASLKLFRNFWANPSYGAADNPGVYFKQSYGGVDFFFLDGRYHRDPTENPDQPGKTMLGAAQKAWLKGALVESKAIFKILVSGTGWSTAENERGGDSWGVYLSERNEIFDFIRDRNITGVACISGDSHMGELNCVPQSAQGGYDIYDLCSSPLAQMPATKNLRQMPEVRIRDTWTRSVNVGVLDFHMGDQPRLTMTLHDVSGTRVWEPLILTPADLTNGRRTWDVKADPGELKRLERFKKGGGYYGTDVPEGWPDRPYYQ
ncbi:alkaline phosphatase D family protein [Niveispirillum sp. KHB5.9]|uniref:alkaline phosphatase D family protein n=1 Tax=Niveispirillum sp. KHB5.9 TaxID=3400269 RepID=UPI003A8B9E83